MKMKTCPSDSLGCNKKRHKEDRKTKRQAVVYCFIQQYYVGRKVKYDSDLENVLKRHTQNPTEPLK